MNRSTKKFLMTFPLSIAALVFLSVLALRGLAAMLAPEAVAQVINAAADYADQVSKHLEER